jgi:hypothetical protein
MKAARRSSIRLEERARPDRREVATITAGWEANSVLMCTRREVGPTLHFLAGMQHRAGPNAEVLQVPRSAGCLTPR